MIHVVDYGRGNLFSIGQALRHLGAEFIICDDPKNLAAASKVILPGVGAFGDCMNELQERGLIDPLRRLATNGTPLLGICVGMQVLFTRGEEFGDHQGLGLIPGVVRRLPEGQNERALRIPNVGWRRLIPGQGHESWLGDLSDGPMVYFVHSYAPVVDDASCVSATIDFNDKQIPVAVRKGNVFGFQFHPEKSGKLGLNLLSRFAF